MARVDSASAAVVFVFVIPEEFAAIVTNKYMEKAGSTSLGTDGSTSPPQDIKSFRGGPVTMSVPCLLSPLHSKKLREFT